MRATTCAGRENPSIVGSGRLLISPGWVSGWGRRWVCLNLPLTRAVDMPICIMDTFLFAWVSFIYHVFQPCGYLFRLRHFMHFWVNHLHYYKLFEMYISPQTQGLKGWSVRTNNLEIHPLLKMVSHLGLSMFRARLGDDWCGVILAMIMNILKYFFSFLAMMIFNGEPSAIIILKSFRFA